MTLYLIGTPSLFNLFILTSWHGLYILLIMASLKDNRMDSDSSTSIIFFLVSRAVTKTLNLVDRKDEKD